MFYCNVFVVDTLLLGFAGRRVSFQYCNKRHAVFYATGRAVFLCSLSPFILQFVVVVAVAVVVVVVVAVVVVVTAMVRVHGRTFSNSASIIITIVIIIITTTIRNNSNYY